MPLPSTSLGIGEKASSSTLALTLLSSSYVVSFSPSSSAWLVCDVPVFGSVSLYMMMVQQMVYVIPDDKT